jgi:hypothetical protein
MDMLPTGGGLQSGLAGLAGDRASGLTSLESMLYGNEMDRATSLATGQPMQTSYGGLGTAAQTQAGLAGAQLSADAQAKAGLTSGIGRIAGSALMKG